jgi:hypothetical protein
MANNTLTMLAVGDLILYHEKPEVLFALAADTLKSADVVVGQSEVQFTARPNATYAKSSFEHVPNPVCPPSAVNSVASAGFNVMTLASNHTWDAGIPGIQDTIELLNKKGVATVGVGMNIDEARRPLVIERKGTRIGFLDYNCVGPEETWANRVKPGCAYLHIVTAYEMNQPCPGSTPNIYTFAEPRTLRAMLDDIHKLRPMCDVLVVKFHKGVGFVQAKLADYEQQISYAAIDAGADLILGEHAHILKGIEAYQGKLIFHGLNHFTHCFQTFSKEKIQEARDWHKELYDLKSEPVAPKEFVANTDIFKTMIAKCIISDGKITKASYLPCLINKEDQPEILKHDQRGQQIFDYMETITREAGLNVRYEWEGDEIAIRW